MSEWQEYTLGDIVDIKHGYAFKGEFFSETPTNNILVTPGNFKIGGGFKSDKLKYYNGEIPDGYVLSHEDIIVTMTDLSKQADTLGYSAKVPIDSSKVFLHNQRIGLLIFKDKSFDKDFIYWLMRAEHYQKFVAGSATGATVKHSSPSRIRAFKFKAPTNNSLRKKIAKILSNYDDLIENNLKRIKLLEESARLTYEEWFLRFRINGKKLDIDAESGLPFGWEFQNMYNLYEIKYGQNLPQTIIKESGVYEVYGASGIMGYHSQKNVSKKVALITSRGNGSSDIHRTYGESFVTNNSFIVRSKNKNLGLNFTLHHLETVGLINYCSGSAQPQLTNDAMKNIKIKLPDKELLIKFNNFAEPLIKISDNLRNQNQLLKEARDILLPRLMTGMIDTDELDIAV